MDEIELTFLVPRAIGVGVRLRRKLDNFNSNLVNEGPNKIIGFGHDINHGITEPIAIILLKTRLQKMAQALMQRAFETNLAGDPARFSVFVDIAERVGDKPVLDEKPMWEAVRIKDYWQLHQAFLTSSLILAYGAGQEGRKRVAYLGRVLVEGEKAV